MRLALCAPKIFVAYFYMISAVRKELKITDSSTVATMELWNIALKQLKFLLIEHFAIYPSKYATLDYWFHESE